MTRKTSRLIAKSESGFTLIELLVVVLIIGILAAIAVPQYFKVVERGKAAEANAWLAAVAGAEESLLARTGNYCTTSSCLTAFDIAVPTTIKYFGITLGAGSAVPDWSATLTRGGGTGGTIVPALYGGYQIKYTHSGVPPLTCAAGTGTTGDCNDMLP